MNPTNLLASIALAVAPAAVPVAAPPTPAITMTPRELTAVLGQTLAMESAFGNGGAQPSIAHLNITSLDGVYVDLEDWTKEVTQPVPPGEDAHLDWEVQAVNSGHFALYVVLIPKNGPLIVSPVVHVTVSPRQTLDTAGALPVALTVPAILGLAALASRRHRT
jgi:hypothetical protein